MTDPHLHPHAASHEPEKLVLSHRFTATVLRPDEGRVFLGLSWDGRMLTILGEPGGDVGDAPPSELSESFQPEGADRDFSPQRASERGKHRFRLGPGVTVEVLEVTDGCVAVGWFWKGELLGVADQAIGKS